MTHFSMGAINQHTNHYEYPKIANKKYKYKCPCCEKDVIFKHGKIKKPHFSHYKSDNPCHYYDNPIESQIHKDAKMLIKSLLDHKKPISIHKMCSCKTTHNYQIEYNENTKAVIEHKFYYNDSNRSADVALIETNKINYIFEICYKNKTNEENRPEPWVEIDALHLINDINSDASDIIINCIRKYKCNQCIHQEQAYMDFILKEQEKQKILNDQEHQIKLLKQQKEQEIQLEILKKQKEKDELCRQYELQMKQKCKCTLMIINICKCKLPNYKLNELSNNLECMNCNKWKCRC